MSTQGISRGRLTEEKGEELMRRAALDLMPRVKRLAQDMEVRERNVVWDLFKLTGKKGGERIASIRRSAGQRKRRSRA